MASSSLDSMQSSSSSSADNSFEHTTKEDIMADETRAAGFEVSTDFVYASSCRTEVKEYVMGQQMMEHELPVTVKELGKLLIHFYPIFQDVLIRF